jgi:hypothetical protein
MVILPAKVGEDWRLMVILPSNRRITIHAMATDLAAMLVSFRTAVDFAMTVLDIK